MYHPFLKALPRSSAFVLDLGYERDYIYLHISYLLSVSIYLYNTSPNKYMSTYMCIYLSIYLLGHGPAVVSLLHQLVTQHLPVRSPVWRQI